MPASLPPTIQCQVVSVHDGDGPIHCANGYSIRTAGIQAADFTTAEPCRQHRAGYDCNDARARASQRVVERLVLGKQLTCRTYERSWDRVVASCTLPDGSDLRCRTLAAGAAVAWPKYVVRYHLEGCR